MSLRDSLLPVMDRLRVLPPTFGLRRFAVTVRRRLWSTQVPGEGTATDFNIVLTPAPRVRDITLGSMSKYEMEFKAANSDIVSGSLYRIDRITPRYTNADGSVGGYLAEQIRAWPNVDTGAIENFISLVGDDGYLRECIPVTFGQDRAFGYWMIVKESDRPRTVLTSIAITPTTASIASATSQALQLTCVGTFNGGATSTMTTLTAWSSSNPAAATVDTYGLVTAIAAGSTIITGNCLNNTSTATITVT